MARYRSENYAGPRPRSALDRQEAKLEREGRVRARSQRFAGLRITNPEAYRRRVAGGPPSDFPDNRVDRGVQRGLVAAADLVIPFTPNNIRRARGAPRGERAQSSRRGTGPPGAKRRAQWRPPTTASAAARRATSPARPNCGVS